jgi:ankyrin repeat protein
LYLFCCYSLVNRKDEEGYTPLHLAVVGGQTAVVRLLLARGAAPDSLDNERHSAVHWAVVCGEAEILRLLHAAGAAIRFVCLIFLFILFCLQLINIYNGLLRF